MFDYNQMADYYMEATMEEIHNPADFADWDDWDDSQMWEKED